MFPPVGDGTGPMIGQTKQSRKMKPTITAGTITPTRPRQRPATLIGGGLVGPRGNARYDEITR